MKWLWIVGAKSTKCKRDFSYIFRLFLSFLQCTSFPYKSLITINKYESKEILRNV